MIFLPPPLSPPSADTQFNFSAFNLFGFMETFGTFPSWQAKYGMQHLFSGIFKKAVALVTFFVVVVAFFN